MDKSMDYIKQCEEGDVYYKVTKDRVTQVTMIKVTHHVVGHYSYKDNLGNRYFGHNFGTMLFKTEEEAKDEVYRRERIKEKRQKLKIYEELLNEELDLEGHIIIK